MALKAYKPTTPGRRHATVEDFSDVTKTTPARSLVMRLKRHSGRNHTGQITTRHRGGGAKRLYRVVDFKRTRYDVSATVEAIEYDPNRGPRLILVSYEDGEKAYYIAPVGVAVGDVFLSSKNKIEPKTGNRMPIEHVPVGLFVYNVELDPGRGGTIVRAAGACAQLQTLEGDFAQLKLPSGEIRLIRKECMVTIGRVGNTDYSLVRLGKAGRMRLKGRRPVVRGKAMNPVDHPHGGGEGSNPIGLKTGPKTKWGKKAMGVKTRKRTKASNVYIIQRRKSRKKK